MMDELEAAGFTVVTDLGWPPRRPRCCSADCCEANRKLVERMQADMAFLVHLVKTRMDSRRLDQDEIDRVMRL